MYRIEFDRPRHMLQMWLSGFWTAEEARDFARDEQEAVRQLGGASGSHLILADVTNFEVQTQEVSGIIRDLVLNAASTSKRIALIGNTGALAAFQSKRITARDGVRFFDDRTEALAWLFEAENVETGTGDASRRPSR